MTVVQTFSVFLLVKDMKMEENGSDAVCYNRNGKQILLDCTPHLDHWPCCIKVQQYLVIYIFPISALKHPGSQVWVNRKDLC